MLGGRVALSMRRRDGPKALEAPASHARARFLTCGALPPLPGATHP